MTNNDKEQPILSGPIDPSVKEASSTGKSEEPSAPAKAPAEEKAGKASFGNMLTRESGSKADESWARRWRRIEVAGLWAAAFVGVFAIYSSRNDANEQLQALLLQAGAMKDQASAMKSQSNYLVSQLRADLRLSFTTTPIGPNGQQMPVNADLRPPSAPTAYTFTPILKNVGGTEAQKVRMEFSDFLSGAMIKDGQKVPPQCPVSDSAEEAKSDATTIPRQESTEGPSRTIQFEDIQKIAAPTKTETIFILGSFTYSDIFEKTTEHDPIHHVEYCYKIEMTDVNRNSFQFNRIRGE